MSPTRAPPTPGVGGLDLRTVVSAGSCSRRQRQSALPRPSHRPHSGPPTRPHATLHPSLDAIASILLNNARVLAAPFILAAARFGAARVSRLAGDAIVATIFVGNAVAVGLALGRWRGALIPFVPQLPIEYLAAATAAGAWIEARRDASLPRHDRGNQRRGDDRVGGRRGGDRGAPHPARPMRSRRRRSLLYVVYLRSPLWRLRRRIWIVRAGGRCQRCRSRRRLTIHHRTYRRLDTSAAPTSPCSAGAAIAANTTGTRGASGAAAARLGSTPEPGHGDTARRGPAGARPAISHCWH